MAGHGGDRTVIALADEDSAPVGPLSDSIAQEALCASRRRTVPRFSPIDDSTLLIGTPVPEITVAAYRFSRLPTRLEARIRCCANDVQPWGVTLGKPGLDASTKRQDLIFRETRSPCVSSRTRNAFWRYAFPRADTAWVHFTAQPLFARARSAIVQLACEMARLCARSSRANICAL